jgi:hypothetical protein
MNIIIMVGLIALIIFLFKNKSVAPKPMLYYIIIGGFLSGFTALILGVIGAIIFYPQSNIAPIIGFIYTGPIGFLLGLLGGAVYWAVKVRGKRVNTTGTINDSRKED